MRLLLRLPTLAIYDEYLLLYFGSISQSELRQGEGESLNGIQRCPEVQMEPIFADLSELANDGVDVVGRHELEVLHTGHAYAPLEIQAVISLLEDGILGMRNDKKSTKSQTGVRTRVISDWVQVWGARQNMCTLEWKS
jgi:hypothetical protein